MARLYIFILLRQAHALLSVSGVDECPGGVNGGWHYYQGRCYRKSETTGTFEECWRQICPRLAGANATKVHVARSGRPVLPHWTTSTLACVTDPQLDEFLSQDVGGSIETFGSWVGLYQDPHNRKHSKRGWDLQASATCQGVTYANWYTDWGEPDHHLGCVESCAVMGSIEEGLSGWRDASCRFAYQCLCEYPAAPSESLLSGVEPYSDRPCDKGRLFYGIFVLAACTVAAAALLLCCVLGVNRRKATLSGHGVGLFPSRNGGLYQIASGFEGVNALQVNRSARIVLQLTFSTLFLGILVKAITLALFEKVLPREYSVSPAFDLAFYVIFASTAAWMCYMAVKTANEEYACGATYLQAFQALVWALAASCAFSLLLLALIDAAGERVNLVVVLNNAAFGGLYFAIGIFTGRLQRDIDALDEQPPPPADGDVELSHIEPDSAEVFEPSTENPMRSTDERRPEPETTEV